ncbi:Vgb family protein [Nocardioides sp. MAHUQ-72]|uniref:Vgb family protein n=1 Tax=unclassified Nocardioides TaxID=2615069 RepID=UPI00360B593D
MGRPLTTPASRVPALVAALVGSTLVGSLLLGGCSSGDATPSDAPATPVEPTDEDSSATVPDGVAVTGLDDGPVGLAAVGSDVWAALPDAGRVLVSGDRGVKVGSLPLRLVDTPEGVWVSAIGDGAVVRIDPGSGEVDRRTTLRPAGSEPEGLAFDGDRVWVVDQAGDRVLPLDPATGKIGAAVEVGIGPRLVAAGPDGVYVSSYVAGSVTRVADGEATTVDVAGCTSPQGLAEAAGVVWVACTTDGRVVGLDARTLTPVADLPDLATADAVVADGDTVHVVGQQGPTVWTIDARTREVTGELVLDAQPRTTENVDAVLQDGHLWVSHPEGRRLYDVPPALLAAGR